MISFRKDFVVQDELEQKNEMGKKLDILLLIFSGFSTKTVNLDLLRKKENKCKIEKKKRLPK